MPQSFSRNHPITAKSVLSSVPFTELFKGIPVFVMVSGFDIGSYRLCERLVYLVVALAASAHILEPEKFQY